MVDAKADTSAGSNSGAVQIAVSSVTASSYSSGHVPALAIDGIENLGNYWGTNALVPAGVVPQWLRLDFGSVCSINTVTTHFYDGDGRRYTYYIQVSNDSSLWTTIVPTKTGSGLVTDTFPQVRARFVKITITANTANAAAHIEEIKAYSSGSVSINQSNANLAVIPNGWDLTYGTGPQIIFLDYNFVHTSGNPSIRLGPHTSADTNTAREVNGHWLNVKPGDHIVAKCWIYCGNSGLGDTSIYHGARFGIDLYTHANTASGAVYGIVDSYPHSGAEHAAAMVRWGTRTWTLKTWDIIVPSTFYTQVKVGTVRQCAPVQIDSFVLWLQVLTPTDPGLAWFADIELYKNPM